MIDLPLGVRRTANEWIETSDGTRLAVRLWRPEVDEPVPVSPGVPALSQGRLHGGA